MADPYEGFELVSPEPAGGSRRANATTAFMQSGDPYAGFEEVAPASAPRSERDHREGVPPVYPPEGIGSSPDPRETSWQDYVKPVFGEHDPVGEVYDTFVEPFTEISSERPIGQRVQDTINFAASVPFHSMRLPSPGEMIESATGLSGARRSEERFVQNNPKILKALGAAGEVAGGTLAPLPVPRVSMPRASAPAPRPTGPAPMTAQPSSMPPSGPARARTYVRDLDELGISRHGPAIAQAARDGEGLGTVAKVVEGMPLVSAPLRRSTREFVESAARAGDTIAQQYSRGGGNIERAGESVRTYLDQFKNARSIPRDAVELMDDAQVRALAQRTPRDVQSLKTATDARYEAAWREIPRDLRRGKANEGDPRLMGGMAATRAVLEDISGRNQRMTLQSGTNAAPAGATAPIAAGGLLGEITKAITHRTSRGNYPWTATLQTMRDIRSTVRRIGSRTADTEANTLSRADLARMESAVTQDMIGLMGRISADARASGNLRMAEQFDRAARGFQVADQFTRRYADAFESVKRLTRSTRDAQAIGTILNAAKAGAGGDSALLLQLKRIAPPELLDDIAAAVINEMGRPTGRASGPAQEAGWSISKFSNQWNSLSPQGRRLIFGHRPEIARRLEKFANVAQGMADYEALANRSASGTHSITGAILLAGPAAIIGNLNSILLSAGAAYGAARWMTSPAYISWLTRSAQLHKSIMEGRVKGQAAESAVRRHGQALIELVKKDRSLSPEAAQALSIAVEQAQDNQVPSLPALFRERASVSSAMRGPQLSSRQPAIKEQVAAWFGQQFGDTRDSHATGKRLVEALDLMSLFTLSGASAAEQNIREGINEGRPGQVALGSAEAILSFLPGFRGSKAAAGKLAEEIRLLERELETLTGQAVRPRPHAISGTSPQQAAHYDLQYRDRLSQAVSAKKDELARANSRLPPSSVPSIDPRPMLEEEAFILSELSRNPYVQAIKGRQGFPTKAEQKALVAQYFRQGGRLPPAPWGRGAGQADSLARDILAVSFASKTRAQQKAIVDGASERVSFLDRAIDRLRKERGQAQAGEIGRLNAELSLARKEAAEARQQAEFWRRLYKQVLPFGKKD
jgi:hypothetical protein